MLGQLAAQGYTVQADPENADLVIVNTCAFIEPAKEESIDTIMEMASLKSEGKVAKIAVAGCLTQRYAPALSQEIPEIDHFLGTGQVEQLSPLLNSGRKSLRVLSNDAPSHPRLRGKNPLVPYQHAPDPNLDVGISAPDFTLTAQSPRMLSTASHKAYVKISEGCSNTCAFCIIPKLRGPQRSRPIADIVAEVAHLQSQGVVEITLIAQDLCAYGKDQLPKTGLAQLLAALHNLADKAVQQGSEPLWIRCMYAYPRGMTQAVMDQIASSPYILPYLDMPLQHISDKLLRTMRRGKGGQATRDLIARLRERIPGLWLRSTLITGLPGETEEDFAELLDFVKEARFEHLGVFAYSPEEDTPAAEMRDQIPTEIAEQRQAILMQAQAEISRSAQTARIGSRIQVIVEGLSEESDMLWVGRHQGQAPEVDGLTYITDLAGTLPKPGDRVWIEVEQSDVYDIAGPIVDGP